MASPAGFEDSRGDGVTALLVAAGDGNLRSFFGEEEGGGLADAGGATGDESDFVFQTHVFLPELTYFFPTHVGPDALVRAASEARQ